MSGSNQPQKVTQEVTQTNLPKYAEPYVISGMQAGQGLLNEALANGMPTYDGQRIAGLTSEQQAVNNRILSQGTPQAINAGQQLAGTAGLGALMTSGYNPSQFTSQSAGAGSASTSGAPVLGGINSQITQQYMSPYIQNVIDAEKREAIRTAQKDNLAGNLQSARLGTYGGSRNLLAQTERERALGFLLGDIQTKGLQSAYDRALSQFNSENALTNQTNLANLDARKAMQIANAQYSTQAAIANQQANLEAQKLAEHSKQFGATQGLAGLQLAKDAAQTLTNSGQVQGQVDNALNAQQMQAAGQQQQLDQQVLSQQYQDFLKEQAYPLEMLQAYSNMIRGNTITPGTTSTIYGQAPSVASQVIGTGLGALSTAKLLGA